MEGRLAAKVVNGLRLRRAVTAAGGGDEGEHGDEEGSEAQHAAEHNWATAAGTHHYPQKPTKQEPLRLAISALRAAPHRAKREPAAGGLGSL
jgi:hypothetical protein